ncbi:MAG TPA: hypothetical protein VFJ72_00540 [Rubrobacteraceae bacterium]|nr:hypothetical protein [Rubrobacteraceae bacterium]
MGSEGFEWEDVDDVTSLSEEELRGRLEALTGEEREISYRRRILQGRIDLIRAELVRRGDAALSPQELARVLMDRTGGAQEEQGGGPA